MLSNSSSRGSCSVAFFEVVLIVVGVLLGLGVNEWQKSVAEDKKADRAMVAIQNELENIYKSIQEFVSFHKKFMEILIP